MNVNIKYIRDENGNIISPASSTDAIFDSSGNTLTSILGNKQNTLTAGTGITINGTTISASVPAASQVLWTNSSPYTAFASKTMNISANSYPYYRIRFLGSASSESRIYTIDINRVESFCLVAMSWYAPGGSGNIQMNYRDYCSANGTEFYWYKGQKIWTGKNGTEGVTDDNTKCVPYQIIGYYL